MARLLLLNGPNLNLLGTREPGIYGNTTLTDIETRLADRARDLGHQLDSLQSKLQDVIIVLGGANGGACSFACAVPNELVGQGFNAGTLAREAAKVTGGGGGGSPQKAKAGGRDASKLTAALDTARELIASV